MFSLKSLRTDRLGNDKRVKVEGSDVVPSGLPRRDSPRMPGAFCVTIRHTPRKRLDNMSGSGLLRGLNGGCLSN